MAYIYTTEELINDKTGIWYFSGELLKKHGLKNNGGNQYVLMSWLKKKNNGIIVNDYIQKNTKIIIPKEKKDVLNIFCETLSLNKKETRFYDLLVCDHEIDGAIEVAKYIVKEIKTNIKSDEAKQIYKYLHYEEYLEDFQSNLTPLGKAFIQPPDPISLQLSAISLWIEMVDTDKPWDHKKKIQEKFSSVSVKNRPFVGRNKQIKYSQISYHKYKYHDYFLDVWSNIHYGFIGRFCGFSENTLLTGSDFQQFVSNVKNLNFSGDDPSDKITMQLGMDLYNIYSNNIEKLNYQIILDALESLDNIGNSRLLHKCFDTSKYGVTSI